MDVDALLSSLTRLRDMAIFLLMLDGGLRPGEVLNLHLEDVAYGSVESRSANEMTTRAGHAASHAPSASWTCTNPEP